MNTNSKLRITISNHYTFIAHDIMILASWKHLLDGENHGGDNTLFLTTIVNKFPI